MMAKIVFFYDGGAITTFDDVQPTLAGWLEQSFKAYHGLVPSPSVESKQAVIIEKLDSNNDDVIHGRDILPVSKAKLPKKVDKDA
jgi:hypothetical protein